VATIAKLLLGPQQNVQHDTIEEFNVDSKDEYSALSSTRSQKKRTKTNKRSAPLIQYKLRSVNVSSVSHKSG